MPDLPRESTWPATGGPPPAGTVAWIVGVGAQEGTGAAIARRFARGGCHVVVTGRTQAKLDAVVDDIRWRGYEASAAVGDAGSEDGLADALAHVDRSGRLGAAVYNAGGAQSRRSILDMDAEFVESVWRVNCLGGLIVGREAARRMAAGDGGVILITGSKSSVVARPKQAAYAIAKFGLRAAAEALAREFNQHDVHVATITPDGPIDGERLALAFPEARAQRGPDGMITIDALAETYWLVATQQRSAWTYAMDLRPFSEPL